MRRVVAYARRRDEEWQDALLDAWARGGREAARALIAYCADEIARRDAHSIAVRAAGSGPRGVSGKLRVTRVSADRAERIITIAARLLAQVRGQIERARRRHDPALPALRARRDEISRVIALARRGEVAKAEARLTALLRPRPTGVDTHVTPPRRRVTGWVAVPDPQEDWPRYCALLRAARGVRVTPTGTTHAMLTL